MAQRQMPHYPHHVRELHRTRRRFWSAFGVLLILLGSVSYLQIGQSHAATTFYLAGVVTRGVEGGAQSPYPNVQVRVTDYVNNNAILGTSTTNASGVWSVTGLTSQAQVRVFILSGTPSGYAEPVATEFSALGMAVPTRSDYPYQVVNGSCYQNSACSNVKYRTYDIAAAHEHSLNFSYTAPSAGIVSFTANPSSVANGAKTTLNWGVTSYTSTCSLTPGGPVNTSVRSWTTGALTTPGTNTFTVTCQDVAGYKVSKNVGVTVAAATHPTPTPSSGPTPKPGGGGATPTPGGGSGGGSSGGSNGGTSGGGSSRAASGGGQAAVPDTSPPSAPSNFQALVSGSNAVIDLSWSAATDNVGVQNYVLERSLDQNQWSVITNTITGTSYTDDSLAYDVTYYYRLTASDAAGNLSSPVTANGHTPTFSANNSSSSPVNYTSDDGTAVAVLGATAISGEVDCSVETQPGTIDVGKLKLVAGAYAMVCKNSAGDNVTDLTAPISWTYKLKNKLKGLGKAQPAQLNDTGKVELIKTSTYNAKAGTLSFSVASFNPTLVMAAKTPPFPWNFVIIVVLVLGIIVGVLLVVVRQTQKRSYDDYLTKKYYNL